MSKQKINIEQALNSKSTALIWNLISTPEGLSRWMADEITQEENQLTFLWGETWSNHQMHKAMILEKDKFHSIRIQWDSQVEDNAYMEIKMVKSGLDENYILEITDFAEPDETEDQKDLWERDFDRLHQATGL